MEKRWINATIIVSLLLVCNQSSCKTRPAGSTEAQYSNKSVDEAAVTGQCFLWDQMVSGLSKREEDILLKEGVVYDGKNIVLGETLVDDCQLRGEMSAYFGRVLNGQNDNERDRMFASSHSKKIIEIVSRIWPLLESKVILGDIDFVDFDDEKYSFLEDQSLRPSDIGPFIKYLIAKDGVNHNLAFIILSRPLLESEVKQVLPGQLEKANKKGDVPQQIYILTIMHRMGEPMVPIKFRKLLKNKNLSSFERKLIITLLSKIKSGEGILYSDVEDMEYLNDRTN